MKLLEIAKAVADETTAPCPESFNHLQLTPEATGLLRAINKAGSFVTRTLDLNSNLKDHTVTPESNYPTILRENLPKNFLRFKEETFRDAADGFYTGPLNYSDFLKIKQNEGTKIFSLLANGVYVYPKPSHDLSFAYFHDGWAKGTRRIGSKDQIIEISEMKKDEDETIVDSALVISFAKYFSLVSMGVEAVNASNEIKYLKKHLLLTEEKERSPFYKYPMRPQRYIYGL